MCARITLAHASKNVWVTVHLKKKNWMNDRWTIAKLLSQKNDFWAQKSLFSGKSLMIVHLSFIQGISKLPHFQHIYRIKNYYKSLQRNLTCSRSWLSSSENPNVITESWKSISPILKWSCWINLSAVIRKY